MKTIITKLISSFDLTNNGFSGRKLTSFWLIVLITYGHWMYLDKDNFVQVLIIDLAAIGLLMGIVTVQQIIEFLGSKKNVANNPPTP